MIALFVMHEYPTLKSLPYTIIPGTRDETNLTSKTTKTAPNNDRLHMLLRMVTFFFVACSRFGEIGASQD